MMSKTEQAAAIAIEMLKENLIGMRNTWMAQLDERQQKELKFARLYQKDFGHGTDGHHRLLLIARLADMLDEIYRARDDSALQKPMAKE